MRRLLFAGALACLALHAQDDVEKKPDEKKQEDALPKFVPRLPIARPDAATLTVKAGSWNCLAPMPVLKPGSGDSQSVVPPPTPKPKMPVLAPPPICGQSAKR